MKKAIRPVFPELGLDIQVIDRGDGFYECVPEGHSKASAIDIILKEYGLKLTDAYVFGDSTMTWQCLSMCQCRCYGTPQSGVRALCQLFYKDSRTGWYLVCHGEAGTAGIVADTCGRECGSLLRQGQSKADMPERKQER